MDKKNNTIIFLASIAIILIVGTVFLYRAGVIPKDILLLQNQSSSTKVDDIEEDVNTTNLDNLDKELDDIANELSL